jgi:hypothetical protein
MQLSSVLCVLCLAVSARAGPQSFRPVNELLKTARVWADASDLEPYTVVKEIGEPGSHKLVQPFSYNQPVVGGEVSPTGRNAMKLEGHHFFSDVEFTPTDRSLHFFWVIKADQNAQTSYHNLVDTRKHNGMCMWINANNRFEMNNCAGFSYDTLISDPPTVDGQWQVVQASVIEGKQNQMRVSTPGHGNGINIETTGYGGTGFGDKPVTYSFFNRNGRDTFTGLVGEVVAFEGEMSQDEQLALFQHLEAKWINGYIDVVSFAHSDQRYCCDPDGSEISLDLFDNGENGGSTTASGCQEACEGNSLCKYFQMATSVAVTRHTVGYCRGYPRCPKYCRMERFSGLSDIRTAQSIFKTITSAPTSSPTNTPTITPTKTPTSHPTVNDVAWLWDHPLCARTYCHVSIEADGQTRTTIKGNGEKENFHCEAYDSREHILDGQVSTPENCCADANWLIIPSIYLNCTETTEPQPATDGPRLITTGNCALLAQLNALD